MDLADPLPSLARNSSTSEVRVFTIYLRSFLGPPSRSMWKPDESLDDYIVRPAPKVTSEPPPPVSLLRTGEVEVLKPLTPEVRVKSAASALRPLRTSGLYQPLWFRRFLALGSAALVMIAMVLVSAIFVGINDPDVAGPDLAANAQPDDQLTQPDEPFSFDVPSPLTFELATDGVDPVRPNIRRRVIRPIIRLAANKPLRRSSRSIPEEQPKFIPTTLVIYAENGVIYSRIEPWLQGGDRKTPSFNN